MSRIILTIQNKSGKNIAFVTTEHIVLSLKEAINQVLSCKIAGIHVVNSNHGKYLRSDPNDARTENLDSLAISAGSLSKQIKSPSENKLISSYLQARSEFLELFHKKKDLIYLDELARIEKKEIIGRLTPLREIIRKAARENSVDPILLMSVLVDEVSRMAPDDWLDLLGKYGIRDTSVGLAQVKISTARELIRKGYYKGKSDISDKKLYNLLSDDKESVKFAAAYLRMTYAYREKRNMNISDEVIATCYSSGYRYQEKKKPRYLKRGKQVVDYLGRIAESILK